MLDYTWIKVELQEKFYWMGALSAAVGPWVLPKYEIGQAQNLPKQ